MTNLKNITDLPVAESAEGLNLIVNDNGAAKQIAAHEVGASSWNDLKDKPFGTETDENGNETIHKLDAKYLPNSIFYVDAWFDEDVKLKTNTDFNEAMSAAHSGSLVSLRLDRTNQHDHTLFEYCTNYTIDNDSINFRTYDFTVIFTAERIYEDY